MQDSNHKEVDLINLHDKTSRSTLSAKDWYWSSISRAQANDLLLNKRDGTFLVRDSSGGSDYTLTVKKDGINKMMRILCINGKYGFHAPAEFNSLESLIEYYAEHSLAEYCPDLDVRLENPLSKAKICLDSIGNEDWNQIDVEMLSKKLKDAHQHYYEIAVKYDEHHRNYKACRDEMQKFKHNLNCFEETFAIFDEQLKLNEENQIGASNHDKEGMKKHYDEIQNKLEEIKEFRRQLELRKEEKINESIDLDRKINELKPLLNEEKRHREQIKAILINKIGNEGIEKILEQSNSLHTDTQPIIKPISNQSNRTIHDNYDQSMKVNYCQIDKEFLSNSCSPNFENNPLTSQMHSINSRRIESNFFNDSGDQNESSTYLNVDNLNFEQNNSKCEPSIAADWYFGDMSKEQIYILMKDQPDGTFLVRDSKNVAETPYTLTVRVNGTTKLLRILKSSDGRYFGFMLDKLEFESVENLINHHLNEPFIIQNAGLTIHLTYPMNKNQIAKLK